MLFWGVLGALIFRGIFIGAGVGLIYRFHWILYVFGGFLVISGIRFAIMGDRKIDPSANPVVRAIRRLIPVTSEYHQGKFFVRDEAKKALYATPLFVVLVMIETTDVLFAVDSIPAVLAVTSECLHRVYGQCVRHPRAAIALFRGIETHETISLPALWDGGGAGAGRNRDAGGATLPYPYLGYVDLCRGRLVNFNRALDGISRASQKIGKSPVEAASLGVDGCDLNLRVPPFSRK